MGDELELLHSNDHENLGKHTERVYGNEVKGKGWVTSLIGLETQLVKERQNSFY